MRKRVARLLFLLILMSLAGGHSLLALENYNGYGGYVIGDQRIVGLAGAYLAKSNDLNAVNYNPAGLVFSPAAMDAGFATSRIDNYPTDFDKNGTKDKFPITYWFGGIIGRTHRADPNVNIATGIVYNTPYQAEQNFDGKVLSSTTLEKYNLVLGVNSFSIPVSLQLNRNFAVGVNVNVFTIDEVIRMKFPVYFPGTTTVFDQVDIDNEQEVHGTSIDAGLLLRATEKLSVGAVYKPEITFAFEEKQFFGQLTGQDTGIHWYRSVTLPLRAGIGVNYQCSPNCAVAVDTNYIGKQDNTVLVGSNLVGGIANYKFKDKGVYDLHLGGNYLLPIGGMTKLDLRAGTYYEPSRVETLDNRWHYTGGAQINWRRLMVGVGYDTAKDYSNLVTVLAILFNY